MIIWILAFAVFNYLRGWGPTDLFDKPPLWRKIAAHVTSKVGTGIMAGFFVFLWKWLGVGDPLPASSHVALIVALGWYVWALRGWGDYWDFLELKNKEIGFIDSFVGRIFKPGEKNDLLSMALRGMFFYPAFVALAWYLSSWWPLLIGLGTLMQGPIYWLQNHYLAGRYNVHKYGNDLSESLLGAWFGLLFWVAIL